MSILKYVVVKQINCLLKYLLNVLLYIEIPETKPTIDGLLNKYRPGDVVRVNCSSEFSKPAANLTWVINDIPVSFFFFT